MEARQLRLEDVEPVHVAAFVEQMLAPKESGGMGYSRATVKQRLAAVKMFGDFLVIRQVLATNPASGVQGPKHVVRTGKAPVLDGKSAAHLLGSIDVAKPAGLRDRAIIGTMLYTFARVSAVCGLNIKDVVTPNRRMTLRLTEKGGVQHQMPVHHKLAEFLDDYLALRSPSSGALFVALDHARTAFGNRRLLPQEVFKMVKRRSLAAGLGDSICNHSFRATGITAYLKNGGQLEHAQVMAAHASPRTTKLYDRRAQEASLDEIERIVF